MIERFTSNIVTEHYIYIYIYIYIQTTTFFIVFSVQSFTQVKNYIMLLAPISSFSFGFSVDSKLDISNVMCPLEENVAVVADQVRLCKGYFHTACSL